MATMHVYLRLNIGAPRRLQALREITRAYMVAGPVRTWRQLRFATFKQAQFRLDFPRQQYAHFVARNMKSRGWFIDSEGRETYTGIVANISRGRWIIGYEDSTGDYITWDRSEVFTDEHEAAQQADEMARIAAEREREHNDRYDESQRMQNEITDKVAEILELRDSHSATMLAAVMSGNHHTMAKRRDQCARMRRDVSVLHATITALRDDLSTNYAEFQS